MTKLFRECEQCEGTGRWCDPDDFPGVFSSCPDCDNGKIPYTPPKTDAEVVLRILNKAGYNDQEATDEFDAVWCDMVGIVTAYRLSDVIKSAADVQALARAVTDNVTQFGTEQNNVANMITAFIEAQKSETPEDIEALVDEYFQEYHVNAVATLPHSTMLDPIEAADDQKERDYLAAKIAAFMQAQKPETPKDIQALARVCYNITKDFFYQDKALEAIAAKIAAFMQAQKPETPKDIKTMVYGWDLWGGDVTQAEQEIAAFCEKRERSRPDNSDGLAEKILVNSIFRKQWEHPFRVALASLASVRKEFAPTRSIFASRIRKVAQRALSDNPDNELTSSLNNYFNKKYANLRAENERLRGLLDECAEIVKLSDVRSPGHYVQ